MTKFIGRIADIGIAKETTRGTAESSATFYLPKMSFTYDDKIEQVIDESSVGVIEDATGASIVGKMAEGEFEGKIGDKSIGLLLLSVFGTVSSTVSETVVYTHSFSVAESAQHQSLTVFQEDPNQDYKYALGMIDRFSLDVSLGQFAKITAGFKSKAGATATLTPSYTAENNFLPQHGTLKYASTTAGLGAGTAVNIKSFKLDIVTNVENEMVLGSTAPADLLNKQFAVSGTVEMIFTDETFKTQLLADTAQALRIRLTNSDVTIGTTKNPQLTFDLNKVKWGEFTRNYGNDDLVSVTASFKAFYDLTTSGMITAELINLQTSY